MTTHNESLKPCPFCAAQPKEFAVGRLYCPTYDCPAGRNVTTPEAWNRRTEQPQPAPMQVDSREAFERWIRESTYANDGLSFHNDLFNAWQAALASRAEHAVPEGWKLVPIEPTPEMFDAAEEAHMPFGDMHLAIMMAINAAPSNKEIER